jgi:hypothetical protein
MSLLRSTRGLAKLIGIVALLLAKTHAPPVVTTVRVIQPRTEPPSVSRNERRPMDGPISSP